ncbi:hypothetical protein HMPREF3156_00709 [Neisseria sp. HMSC06F02]|nr:hypothetical protein HMPREF3156_00709 [Neisseria sp. HMSC06F02]
MSFPLITILRRSGYIFSTFVVRGIPLSALSNCLIPGRLKGISCALL